MSQISRIRLHHWQFKKRLTALAFLLCFIAISMFARVFILAHADHAHDNNGISGSCATCAQIQSAENLTKRLGTAIVNALSALTGMFAMIAIIKFASPDITNLTPVALKNKMNN